MKKYSVFEFNHIDKLLKEEEIETLKEFYKYYHKKFWCYKKTFKHFKIIDESMSIAGYHWYNNRRSDIESNNSWSDQWIWNTSHKFWKNEKLQKENRNDKNSFHNL